MGIEDDIQQLQEEGQRATMAVALALLDRDTGLQATAARTGVTIEYVEDSDHLYVAFGEARPGVAFFMGRLVILVNPEDSTDIVGIEIPMYKLATTTGSLARFRMYMPLLRLFPRCVIPARQHSRGLLAFLDIVGMAQRMSFTKFIGGLQRSLVPA